MFAVLAHFSMFYPFENTATTEKCPLTYQKSSVLLTICRARTTGRKIARKYSPELCKCGEISLCKVYPIMSNENKNTAFLLALDWISESAELHLIRSCGMSRDSPIHNNQHG